MANSKKTNYVTEFMFFMNNNWRGSRGTKQHFYLFTNYV